MFLKTDLWINHNIRNIDELLAIVVLTAEDAQDGVKLPEGMEIHHASVTTVSEDEVLVSYWGENQVYLGSCHFVKTQNGVWEEKPAQMAYKHTYIYCATANKAFGL